VKIPDVNVWRAAAWSRHSKHGVAKHWIDEEPGELAFCRVSQMALLRLLTNPRLKPPELASLRTFRVSRFELIVLYRPLPDVSTIACTISNGSRGFDGVII